MPPCFDRVILQIPFAESGNVPGREMGGEFFRHFPLPYHIAGGGEDKGEAVLVLFGQADALFGEIRDAAVCCRILDNFLRNAVHIAKAEAVLVISRIVQDGGGQEDQVRRS